MTLFDFGVQRSQAQVPCPPKEQMWIKHVLCILRSFQSGRGANAWKELQFRRENTEFPVRATGALKRRDALGRSWGAICEMAGVWAGLREWIEFGYSSLEGSARCELNYWEWKRPVNENHSVTFLTGCVLLISNCSIYHLAFPNLNVLK